MVQAGRPHYGGNMRDGAGRPQGEYTIAVVFLNLDLDFVTKIYSSDWQAIASFANL